MVDQPNPAASACSHLAEVLELLRKLMDYRSSEVRQRLEKVGRVASMLHMDVLLLIYHFSRASQGNILEIGPYVGGSTIAAAFGARDSRTRKTIVSIEAGGQLKHFRLSSRNTINDLRKNLVRFGVAGDVSLINGRSFRRGNNLRSSSAVEQRRRGPVRFSTRTIICVEIWTPMASC